MELLIPLIYLLVIAVWVYYKEFRLKSSDVAAKNQPNQKKQPTNIGNVAQKPTQTSSNMTTQLTGVKASDQSKTILTTEAVPQSSSSIPRNRGKSWYLSDQEELARLYHEGKTILELAIHFERSEKAIEFQINNLGLHRETISPSAKYSNHSNEINNLIPLTIERKPNWLEFEKILKVHNIHRLYHFTDKRNISSIKKYGALYSWSYCNDHGITIPSTSSNNLSKALDIKKSLEDFVRLSLNPSQPMMYLVQKRGIDPIVLEISSEVVYWLETRFSNVNATANNAIVGASLQHFQNINLSIALGNNWTSQEEKALFQAEVLVKTKIPIQYIYNI